jgi:predicted dehydrogenase
MTAALPFIENPMFIEVHRLSGFNPRGTDVPVVLDLMIHDIDIVLHTVKSEVKSIHASGVAVVTTTPDIVNARIEFKNGCVANLTSSRISLQNMRKARFFQRDAYIAVDFLNKKTEVAYLRNASDHLVHNSNQLIQPGNGLENKQIHFVNPTILPVNAIQTELTSFAHSILNNLVPEVTITDGYQALEIAYRILDQVALNQCQHNNENAAQHATN